MPACSSAPAAAETDQLRDQVRATETAFAQTMADRDFEGFQSFLSADAIFIASGLTLTGKQEVADAWEPLFQAAAAPFSWQPQTVEVLASGDLALSSGPISVDGKEVATFTSIWRRQSDGSWKIVFDFGSE